MALAMITFLDRIAIASAGPRIQQALQLSACQWGWVLGAFILAYGVFEIPTGAIGDRNGPRNVLTRIVIWWSAFTALTGAAFSFAPLVAIRFLFGAGEAGAYPNMAAVTARWFSVKERAQAQGRARTFVQGFGHRPGPYRRARRRVRPRRVPDPAPAAPAAIGPGTIRR